MEPNQRPKIFISYRQDDSSGYVNHLQETLVNRYGKDQVFRDIRSLKAGDDFVEVINKEVTSSNVVLVVIARSWLSSIKQKQAEGKVDHVRMEVAAALKARGSVLVVPVLVQGAPFPAKDDLPDDLQDLGKPHASILSDRWWQQDVERLIAELNSELGIVGVGEGGEVEPRPRKRRRSNSENSILGGALAGLITGTIVGIAYTLTEDVPWWRFLLASFYGLLAGALVSWGINAGVEKVSHLMGSAPVGKVFGALLGGTLSGLVAGLIGGFSFAWLSGNVVNPGWIVAAVAISSACITSGILLPDLREDWGERLLVLVMIVAITGTVASVVAWLLFEKISVLDSLVTRSPFSLGIIILGSLCGAMAGAQVGLALLVYEFRSRRLVRSN